MVKINEKVDSVDLRARFQERRKRKSRTQVYHFQKSNKMLGTIKI